MQRKPRVSPLVGRSRSRPSGNSNSTIDRDVSSRFSMNFHPLLIFESGHGRWDLVRVCGGNGRGDLAGRRRIPCKEEPRSHALKGNSGQQRKNAHAGELGDLSSP
jgi:hypothetical protein